MGVDVGETLTAIQVGIEGLRGEVNTGFAELRTQRVADRDAIDRHERELQAMRLDVDALKSARDVSRGRAAGIAIAASLMSAGGSVGLLKIVGALVV